MLNLVLIVILLGVCVAVPLGFALRLWRLRAGDRLGWLLAAAEAALVVFLVMSFGRWDIAGAYTRWILLALFAAAALVSLWRSAGAPWVQGTGRGWWRGRLNALASVALAAAASAYVAAGLAPRAGAHALAFPLEGGRFMVAHGGANPLLNHHHAHGAQRYALDITGLNDAGFRARGLLPKNLEAYEIYGAQVVSPCDGRVVATHDGLPDLQPPVTDRENAKGNHVVVSCGDVRVELAHLMRGSVEVRPGGHVSAGDPIGRVGNSGNTTEPHLHAHAVDARTGLGVPMEFDGRQPVRNAVFRR